MDGPKMPTVEVVHQQLERILASSAFANSARSQRFLRYVVEHSLGENTEPLKEYSIAVEAFDRDPSYDPSVDATVRVEAGRLRSRLRDYYVNGGQNDPLLLEIPRGSYRAVFTVREPVIAIPNGNVSEAAAIAAEPAATASPRRPVFGWIALAGLLALTAAGIFVFRKPVPPLRGGVPAQVVLAVLPFVNQTGVQADNYFTEGLTDNLIRQFSELPRLRVVSRAAIDATARGNIVSQLGATVLLTGELQRASDGHLVLNSELSNARDGGVIRSSQYLPNENDLRTVQADIVRDVISGMGMQLESRESVSALRPLTSSPAAFQDFLRAETFLRNGDESDVIAAIALLHQAEDKDPSFAQAFASMSEAQAEMAVYFESPRPHFEQARQSALRAIALDPQNPDAHGVLGLIHLMFDWDFPGAQAELSQLDRRVDAIWHFGCTAHLLERSGNMRHAEEELQRMRDFDPNSPWLITELGCVNYYAGRYDESIRYYRQSLAEVPQGVLGNWGLARSLAREGKYAESLDVLDRYSATYGFEHPLMDAEAGYVRGLSGDHAGARAMIERLKVMSRTHFVDPFFIAEIYFALDEQKETYLWLDKAFIIHSPFLVSLATDPRWSAVQGDPRFQALWDKMTRYGAQHGANPSTGI